MKNTKRADHLAVGDHLLHCQQVAEVYAVLRIHGFGRRISEGRSVRSIRFVRMHVTVRLPSGQFWEIEYKPKQSVQLASAYPRLYGSAVKGGAA